MQVSAFLLQLCFYNLLCVVPSAPGIRHENSLIQTEQGNRYQVANKEVRLEKRKRQRDKEDGQENIQHASLCVAGTDMHHSPAVANGRSCGVFKMDVGFDELDSTISSGNHGLRGSS